MGRPAEGRTLPCVMARATPLPCGRARAPPCLCCRKPPCKCGAGEVRRFFLELAVSIPGWSAPASHPRLLRSYDALAQKFRVFSQLFRLRPSVVDASGLRRVSALRIGKGTLGWMILRDVIVHYGVCLAVLCDFLADAAVVHVDRLCWHRPPSDEDVHPRQPAVPM